MSHLVHTGSVDVPNAAAQCTRHDGFQSSSTSLKRPEAKDGQLYLVIELYRPYTSIFLAHQEQSCFPRAAALSLDGHTLISFGKLTAPRKQYCITHTTKDLAAQLVNAACGRSLSYVTIQHLKQREKTPTIETDDTSLRLSSEGLQCENGNSEVMCPAGRAT